MNVFFTIDTEVWPRYPDWADTTLARDINRDIYGETAEGNYGVPYQIDVFNAHGLKAVFLVEALFACAVGMDPLRKIVNMVQSGGHDVQLHLHSEWLNWLPDPILPNRFGQNMKDFLQEEQSLLIALGLENLRLCGAENVCAFRAGNYGADFDTLKALAANGIAFDTSYNQCYLDSDCGLRTPKLLVQPHQFEGVYEYPISFFRDYPGHYRHLQLTACSSSEIEHTLLDAWRRGWSSFVLVSHSFELITGRKHIGQRARPDYTVIRRFERLCRFLDRNRDKFHTATFSELSTCTALPTVPSEPLSSGIHRTIGRVVEQLARRVR